MYFYDNRDFDSFLGGTLKKGVFSLIPCGITVPSSSWDIEVPRWSWDSQAPRWYWNIQVPRSSRDTEVPRS